MYMGDVTTFIQLLILYKNTVPLNNIKIFTLLKKFQPVQPMSEFKYCIMSENNLARAVLLLTSLFQRQSLKISSILQNFLCHTPTRVPVPYEPIIL
jgi:hypothetical protein